jgi:SNF2 family DNA or RNA helicase
LNLHVDLAFCTSMIPIVFEYSGKAESGLRMEEILIQCKVRKTHFPFLFVDKTSTKKLPSPDFLAMFSIVITTNQRFTNEWKNGSFEEEMKRESADTSTKSDHEFYSTMAQSALACTLLKVNWLRMIVDEGHSMGRGRDNSAISFASWVEAERRWAMTGTPTRQTSAQSGLSSIVNLMQYLNHDFFSRRQDGATVWQNLIARGWNKGLLCSLYRLRSLLQLLMVRHTKRDIEELQPPRYQTTTLQMSSEEVKTYNTLVCAVQSNLIITSMKGKTSGLQDSLLHRSQGKHARDAMRNIRLVCSGGTQVVPTLSVTFWNEFLSDMNNCNPEPSKMEEVKRYLSRAVTEQLSPCGCCGIMLTTLLVFPCGDLVCTECVNAQSNACVVCEKEFDVDLFQRLQPGMDYQWLHNIEEEAKKKKAKAIKPKQEEPQEGTVELPDDGAGMLAPIDESRQRRRVRKPGDGHECVYCVKRADGTCELCWKPHDSCNLVTKSGKCEVCHLRAESCPSSETKPSYVISRLLELLEVNQKHKEGRRLVSDKVIKSEVCCSDDKRPLKVIVFSQFRKVLNTIGDRLLKRFGTACVAEYWGKYRKQELHKFVYEEDCFCMLLGKDGSEGLDLSFVTHIYFIEQVWDKSLQQQAVSRAYRMGAKGSVFVETLIAASSVEETMFRLENMLEDEHQVDTAKGMNELHTVQSATLSTKDTDYQRAKLQFLLKSLQLISNSSTSSFGATKRHTPTAGPEPDLEPKAKRRKVVKGRVRFNDDSFKTSTSK